MILDPNGFKEHDHLIERRRDYEGARSGNGSDFEHAFPHRTPCIVEQRNADPVGCLTVICARH